MTKVFSREELDALTSEASLSLTQEMLIGKWLDRGDGVAVYQNREFGHPEMGHRVFTSYGSSEAQIETAEPPERLPDMGDQINWRYVLEATYRERRTA